MLREERNGRTGLQQLPLTLGQQFTADGAAACRHALGQQGLITCVVVEAQPIGRKTPQNGVDAAVGTGDRRHSNGVVAFCHPGFKIFLRDLLNREEEGQFPLPNAVDCLHSLGQTCFLGNQDGNAHQIRTGDCLPGGPVEGVGVAEGGSGIAGSFPVIDAAHRQPVGNQPGDAGINVGVDGQGHGLPGCGGQRLPQLGGRKGGVLGVEQQTPGGVGIADGSQAGGGVRGIQGGGAPLVENQVLGGLHRTGILDQTERVHQAVSHVPPQKETAGSPVVQIEAAAGNGGVDGKAIAAAGAQEKFLIAGHSAGQRQLVDEVVVRLGEVKNDRQGVGGGYADLFGIGQTCQSRVRSLDGREFHRIGRMGLRREHPLKRIDKILGGDGVMGILTVGGLVGQAGLQIKGVSQSVGRDLPVLAKIILGLTVCIQTDQTAI